MKIKEFKKIKLELYPQNYPEPFLKLSFMFQKLIYSILDELFSFSLFFIKKIFNNNQMHIINILNEVWS